jgi:hypothetical protein
VTENGAGEGLARVESAWVYMARHWKGGRVSAMWAMLIVFFVTMTSFSTLFSI